MTNLHAKRLLLAGIALMLAKPVHALQDASGPGDVRAMLDLGLMEVQEERWTYDQEVVMRMIRHIYDMPQSNRAKDRDKWRCWIDPKPGSRIGYLWCARNGDIMARRPAEFFSQGLKAAGYGTHLRSTQPVNQSKFEKLLKSFRGGDEFNQEFLALLMQGERPPRHVPTDEELSAFAAARQELESTAGRVTSSRLKSIAMRHGLTRNRYVQIEQHLATYETVRKRFAGVVKSAR
jgi:hypothetical protein